VLINIAANGMFAACGMCVTYVFSGAYLFYFRDTLSFFFHPNDAYIRRLAPPLQRREPHLLLRLFFLRVLLRVGSIDAASGAIRRILGGRFAGRQKATNHRVLHWK